jgi:hypothetical protein
VRVGQQVAPRETLPLVERLEDECFLLGAHAAYRADPPVFCRRLEVVDRADAELAVEHGDSLRTDALQVKKIENRRRKLGDEIAVIGGVARLADA